MRLSLFALALSLSGAPLMAQADADPWRMPEEESKAWLKRVKEIVIYDGWKVTAKNNDIIVQREAPVVFGQATINGTIGAVDSTSEGTYRITLRFRPKVSIEKYEKMEAENEAYHAANRALERKHGVSRKLGQIRPSTPEGAVKLYLEESSRLVFHDLPDLYTPDYSISFIQSWSALEYVDSKDKDVKEECDKVEGAILKYFGIYDYLVATRRRAYGQFEPIEEEQ